jgi:xylulokinase
LLLVGIDIGTTNIKGIVFNPDGTKVSSVSRPTRTHYHGTEIADYYPEEIWGDVKDILKELVSQCPYPEKIGALSFASFGEAGLAVDVKGKPLAPSITWFDHRSNQVVEEWKDQVDEYEVFRITGMRIGSMSSVAKILWEKRNLPDVYRRIKKWLFVPSYILLKLTGEYRTDYSMATRSMLFDITKKAWSEKMCQLADIPIDLMPPAEPSGTPIGHILPKVAAYLGLKRSTLVVLGGHDHLCGAFSAGLRQMGDLVNSSGTTDTLCALIDPGRIDEGFYNAGVNCGCHVVADQTYLLGGIFTAGRLIDWFIDNFYPDDNDSRENLYHRLIEHAKTSPVGSKGLVVFPHLRGCFTPHYDPISKGAILGLRTTHTHNEIARAVFEGLGLEFRVVLNKFKELTGDRYPEVICIGGGSKNRFWTQLKADITGRPLVINNIKENTSLGAAILAGLGAGIYRSAAHAFEILQSATEVLQPDPENLEIYRQIYDQFYCNLYEKMTGVNLDIEGLLKILDA